MGLDYTGDDKTELDQKINDGVLDLLRRTRCYQVFGNQTLTAGDWQYAMDSAVLSMIKVYTACGELERVGTDELIHLQTTTSAVGSPGSRYALAGASTLLIYPTPGAADVLGTLYVPRPTALSGPTDDPSDSTHGGIPAEWHYGIELYALWKMADSTDDQSSAQGERYRGLYEGQDSRSGYLGQIRAEMYRKGGRIPRARLTHRRRVFGRYNDVHYGW